MRRRYPNFTLLLSAGLLLAMCGMAMAADGSIPSYDVIDLNTTLPPVVRFSLYGLVFFSICLLSVWVPDAPLLICICSMPIVEFNGLRVLLTLLQCAVVLLRTGRLTPLLLSRPLMVFLVCVVASVTWALDPAESLSGPQTGVLAMLLMLPMTVAASSLLRAQLTTVRRLLWVLTVSSVPGCILTIQNALQGVRYADDAGQYYMGLIPPDVFSPMLVMTGILLLMYLTSPRARVWARFSVGLMLGLWCVTLLLSGIRSGWVGFGVAAFFMLVRRRSLFGLGAAFTIGALVLLLSISDFSGLDLLGKASSRLATTSTAKTRITLWEVAAKGFLKRPVLGIGWGCFPQFAANHGVGTMAVTHNIAIRTLCELGVVGCSLFLAWVFSTLLRSRTSPDSLLVQSLMLGILLQGMFLDHFVCSYFWLFLGVCDGVVRPLVTVLVPQPESWAAYRAVNSAVA